MYALLITAVLSLDPFGASGQELDPFGDMRPAGAATAPAPSAPIATVIDVYAPSWCSGCPAKVAAIRQIPGMTVRVHSVSQQYPAWTASVGGVYPIVAWHDGTRIRYVNDFSTAENLQQRYAATFPRTVVASQEAAQAPTPMHEVRRVLTLLRPHKTEVFVDYGCGDGRWLIEAARTYGCSAVGVEIDPVQADIARRAVVAAGVDDRVRIIEGDALTVQVEAQVGVAYLYGDVLARLKPRLLKLNRFATYMHKVDGVAMQQNGDAWLWQKPAPVHQAQQRAVLYDGQWYTGRVCNSPNCPMCNAIARQLGY